jgi:hypothetical protein
MHFGRGEVFSIPAYGAPMPLQQGQDVGNLYDLWVVQNQESSDLVKRHWAERWTNRYLALTFPDRLE